MDSYSVFRWDEEPQEHKVAISLVLIGELGWGRNTVDNVVTEEMWKRHYSDWSLQNRRATSVELQRGVAGYWDEYRFE